MSADPVTIAYYRAEQERRQWIRIEDVQRKHDLSDGQIIDAWRKRRISPRVDVAQSQFWDDSGGVFIHMGDYPLEVLRDFIPEFSADGIATIRAVCSAVLHGDPKEWDGGLYTAPDGRCMVDYGRHLVLASPIRTRLGALWIGENEVAKLIEQPGMEVITEALAAVLAPPAPPPPKGQKLDAQIKALVRVIEGMGYDPLNLPDKTKSAILDECQRLHPDLFPPSSGALNAWRQASKRGIIRHHQKRN